MGANKYTESYTPRLLSQSQRVPRGEDPRTTTTTFLGWGVSLRPTLIYEISTHISAELMLDLLSIGFVSETETYDPEISGIDPIERKTQMFYAGLNSFTDVLRWENTLLKLGFNWTF